MAKTLIYQLYLFGFLEKGQRPTRFHKHSSPIAKATQHLDIVADLGADVVWLGPIFKSPWLDHGYDIAGYYEIDSYFGYDADFSRFVKRAHQLGLKVIIDLVLNHTSTAHGWFTRRPEFYCWSHEDRPDWHDFFSGGPAWQNILDVISPLKQHPKMQEYCQEHGNFYLHSFHETQADLNWFPDGSEGEVNPDLVAEFHKIIDYWVKRDIIDGFRIDVPQAINKDFDDDELDFTSALFGDQSVRVLNAVLEGHEDLFYIMECFDPTMGELVQYYTDSTPVDFVLNVMLKDKITQDVGVGAPVQQEDTFLKLIKEQAQNPQFMLDLESHDAPRFPSRGYVTPADAIWYMFNSNAQGICLYQGQELGLNNPSKEDLSDDMMMKLDAQTAMRYVQGEDLDELRPLSRANARVPLPLEEYKEQMANPCSYYHLTKEWIRRWRAEG